MTDRSQQSLSARHLVVFFLAGVAVCGVFFALGFLVGYNQRPAAAQVETERLVSTGAVPPTVNPPPDGDKGAGSEAAAAPSGNSGVAPEGEGSNPPPPRRAGSAAPEVSETTIQDQPPGRTPGGQGSKAVAAGLAIQVVASSSRQDAATLVDVLKTRGYSAFLVTPEEARLGDKLYRVEVGPFSSRQQAEKIRQKLVSEGFKPFIRHD